MTKASNLRWRPNPGGTTMILYGDIDNWTAQYPLGSASKINAVCYHAFAKWHRFEPMKHMADFTTQQEAMDFVQLMVGSTDYD